MERQDAEKLIETIRGMVREPKPTPGMQYFDQIKAAGNVKSVGNGKGSKATEAEGAKAFGSIGLTEAQIEDLYQRFRDRFIDEAKLDPVLLRLMVERPEMIVEYERRVETLDGGTTRGRVARLIAAGWFSVPRATSAVRKELARTGADPGGGGTLSTTLADFKRNGFLLEESGGWLGAPGCKVTEKAIEA